MRMVHVSLLLKIATITSSSGITYACDDPLDQNIEKVEQQWPLVDPWTYPQDWVEYFVLGYNAQPDRGDDVMADTSIAFPMDEQYSTRYFIAGLDGCMSFWIDLNPNRAYHLVELGHAIGEGR